MAAHTVTMRALNPINKAFFYSCIDSTTKAVLPMQTDDQIAGKIQASHGRKRGQLVWISPAKQLYC